MKKYKSVQGHLPPNQDISNFLAHLGEAYELCALHAMPGEAEKSGKDVVKMQIKALEYFEEAQRFDLALKANIRLTFLQHFPFLAQCFVTVVASKRCRTRQSVRQLAIFL